MADRKSVARNGTRHGRDTVTRTNRYSLFA